MSFDVFQNANAAEMAAWEAFQAKYSHLFPPPDRPTTRLMAEVGWQFILIMLQSTGAIILAALRTAEMFYIAASASNVVLRYVEAASAILAVEFGIVVYGAIRSESQNRKASDDELLSAIKVSLGRLVLGEVLGLTISVVAGLGVSFRGFGIDANFFKWVLSIVIGAGASVIAAVSGDVLGAMLARYGNMRDKAIRAYRKELSDWQDAMYAKWQNSPERQIARTDLEIAKAHAKSRRRGGAAVRSFGEGGRTNERISNPTAEKIFEYLDANANPSNIPGPTEIADALGVSKGYASEKLREWRAMGTDGHKDENATLD